MLTGDIDDGSIFGHEIDDLLRTHAVSSSKSVDLKKAKTANRLKPLQDKGGVSANEHSNPQNPDRDDDFSRKDDVSGNNHFDPRSIG